MKHTAFFGDSEYAFALPTPLIEQLERKAGHGIGAIFRRVQAQEFSVREVAEVIRFGLIGGGTDPVDANALVKTYVEQWPLADNVELAHNILFARFFGFGLSGIPQDEPDQPAPEDRAAKLRADIAEAFASDVQHAAATGDLGAALNEVGNE